MAKKKKGVDIDTVMEDARYVLQRTRLGLMSVQPFVASLAMNMELIPARDQRIDTACVTGNKILVDVEFLSTLSDSERAFVLAHEVYHIVMHHFGRKYSWMDHKLFNMAGDLEVNGLLEDSGMSPPRDVLLAEKFGFPSRLSAEEYYELLTKNHKAQESEGGMGNNPSAKGGKPLSGQFDDHDFSESSQPIPGRTKDKYGDVPEHDPNVDAALDEAEAEAPGLEEKMKAALVAAAQEVERRERGTIPGRLASVIKKLTEPEINWQDVLARYVSAAADGANPSWTNPNRRFVWSGTYLPSHRGENLSVAVGLDTSGSTSGDMNKFMSEVTGIVSAFGSYTMDVIHCDTKVQHVDHWTDDDPPDFEADVEIHGGGGTTLRPIFDHIVENDLNPAVIVVFTDGWIDRIPESAAAGVPTLWVLTGDNHRDEITFGDITVFKKDQ